jgi:hypothetical protein
MGSLSKNLFKYLNGLPYEMSLTYLRQREQFSRKTSRWVHEATGIPGEVEAKVRAGPSSLLVKSDIFETSIICRLPMLFSFWQALR